jgi:hypothetical protein
MGKKMGEKRGEDMREPVIYRIRSLRQNAKDCINQPKGRKGPMHEDRRPG